MNSDKCHLLVAGHKFEQIWAKIDTDLIWKSNSVKVLRTTIDNHLKFDKHISLLCAKANRKLSALARISYYLTFHQKRTLRKAFFESQFRYCSLTWMFHSRKSNNKINLLHDRALRMIYNEQISSYKELLEKYHSFTVHHYGGPLIWNMIPGHIKDSETLDIIRKWKPINCPYRLCKNIYQI